LFVSTGPKMIAKEAAFFLLIILSPLALGSKTPVKPKGKYNSVATKRRCSLFNKTCPLRVVNKKDGYS